jgi:hypothetical protein
MFEALIVISGKKGGFVLRELVNTQNYGIFVM